jgi:hypothetical protein
MRRQPTLLEKIRGRIAERPENAFLTREFLDLGGERQVLRALRALTEAGELIRLGYGAYARAERSILTNRPMLAGNGFNAVTRQVLSKLNIPWKPGSAEQDYNEGRSTQVPMRPLVRLAPGTRFSRKLRHNTMELTIER